MSFIDSHFREENMTEYEKTFKEIWAHSTKVYDETQDSSSLQCKGKLFSYCSEELQRENINTEFGDCEEKIFKLDEIITPETNLMRGDYNSGQLNIQPPFTDFPIKLQMKHGHSHGYFTVAWYNPINRIIVTCDLYHEINTFTNDLLNAIKALEKEWEKMKIEETEIEEIIGNEKKHMMIDGGLYEVQEINKEFINMNTTQEKYERILQELKRRGGGNESNVKLKHEDMVKFCQENIIVRPRGRRKVYFYKEEPLVVDRVLNGDETPVEIPEDKKRTIDDNIIMIEATRTRTNSEALFPLTMNNVYINNPHPHRRTNESGINIRDFKEVCRGGSHGISRDDLTSPEDVVERIEESMRGLRTVNLASPLDTDAYVNGEFLCKDYATFYLRCAEDVSDRTVRHLSDEYCIDGRQIRYERSC